MPDLAISEDAIVPEVVKLGRPLLADPTSGLHASHRRVAMMRAADMCISDIAKWMECSEETVGNILRLPKVQKLMLKFGALTTDDLRPHVEEVNELYAETCKEAFEVEVELMRNNRGSDSIEGQKLCFSVAKDIQDRAGAGAPKRIETKSTSLNLGADNLSQLALVLRELDAI